MSTADPSPPPRRNPDPTRCSFFVEQKKRFCRFQLHKGVDSPFCSLHLIREASDSAAHAGAKKRVPCPLNGNHSVLESEVQKHVLVCPDRRWTVDIASQPFFCKGLHVSMCGEQREQQQQQQQQNQNQMTVRCDERVAEHSHRSLSADELLAVWKQIVRLFREHVAPTLNLSSDPWIREALFLKPLAASSGGASTALATKTTTTTAAAAAPKSTFSQKHSPQHDGLVDSLRSLGAIGQKQGGADCVVELGAGKAGLSLAIADACVAATNSQPHIVVVDRGGFRRRADSRVAQEGQRNEEEDDDDHDQQQQQQTTSGYRPFQRVRIDMADFDLWKLPLSVEKSTVSAALVGKHLCGICTDFAISSALLSSPNPVDDNSAATASSTISSVNWICLAPCCHLRCERRLFHHLINVVKQIRGHNATLLERVEKCCAALPPELFSLSCWATCGHERRRERSSSSALGAANAGEHDAVDEEAPLSVSDFLSGDSLTAKVPTTPKTRERAGRLCKLIVDWIRGTILVASGKFSSFTLRPFVMSAASEESTGGGESHATKENWVLLAC